LKNSSCFFSIVSCIPYTFYLAPYDKVSYNKVLRNIGERLGMEKMEEKEKTSGSSLGNEIQNIVQSAVSQGNFQNLNRQITKTVNTAIDQVNKELGQVQNRIQEKTQEKVQESSNQKMMYRDGTYTTYSPEEKERPKKEEKNPVVRNYNHVKQMQPIAKRYDTPLVCSNPPGRISNIVATTFGAIGAIAFGLAEFIFIVLMMVTDAELSIPFGILLPFLVGSIFLLIKGSSIRKRLSRYREYVKRLHGRTFCPVKELALSVDKDEKFVIKDLKKMLERNMFPQGRLSDKKDYLLLNAESFEQYTQAQNALEQRKEKEAEERRLKESSPYFDEMKETVTEGENYLKQIREANDAISGEEISKKLYDLEDIVRRIFIELEKNPDKISEMKKFMAYYLPTTIKLVNAYREFDKYTVETDNIKNSKKEIENTIDTIIKAFYKLYDSLFDDKAMDIATDISVLNTMLAQEGLKESDFK